MADENPDPFYTAVTTRRLFFQGKSSPIEKLRAHLDDLGFNHVTLPAYGDGDPVVVVHVNKIDDAIIPTHDQDDFLENFFVPFLTNGIRGVRVLKEIPPENLNKYDPPKPITITADLVKKITEEFITEVKNSTLKSKQVVFKHSKHGFFESSFVEDNGHLWEQIYDQVSNTSKFACWDGENQTVTYVDFVKLGHAKTFFPIQDPALEEGAVLLPTGCLEYESTQKLIDEIQAHIHKYCDVSPTYEKFATWYVLLTWVYDKLNTLPYLRVLGDTGCGKSRFLDVVGRLCYKATLVSGAVTPAPIYRMIKKWRGTLVFDEADRRNSDVGDEVVTILNCGFERGRPVIRSQKDKPDNIQTLPTFSPKVFATRHRFKDVALESRCLTEKMRETSRTDLPYLLPTAFYEREVELRNKLLMFRFRNREFIDTERAQLLDLGDVEPRLKQATASFAVLFSSMQDVLSDFRDFLTRFNAELVDERSTTIEGLVVNAIIEIQTARSPVTDVTNVTHVTIDITPKDIANRIKENGTDVTPQKVGSVLKTIGLETVHERRNGALGRFLRWTPEQMEHLKRRYVPVVPVTSDTSVTSVTGDRDKENHTQPQFTPLTQTYQGRCSYCSSEVEVTHRDQEGNGICYACSLL